MDPEDGRSLSEILDQSRLFFAGEGVSNTAIVNCLNSLFDRLKCAASESTSDVKDVASFLRDVAAYHPIVSQLLLENLPLLHDPLPFLEVMSSVLSIESPPVVEAAFQRLKDLMNDNNRFLMPAINAIVDLPLNIAQQEEFVDIAEKSIAVVEESDLPALFRTLLKSISPHKVSRAVLRFREELSSLSEESVALMIEAMWEVLPSSPAASEALLSQILCDQDCNRMRQPSLADVSIMLILMSNIGSLRAQAKELLRVWLRRGVFPFARLHSIVELRRSNEVWDRMVPAIWRLSIWSLEELSDPLWCQSQDTTSSSSASAIDASGSNAEKAALDVNTCGSSLTHEISLSGLIRLIQFLYSRMPSMRETILGSILNKCTSASDQAEIMTMARGVSSLSVRPGKNSSSSNLDVNISLDLPPLQSAWNTFRNDSGSSPRGAGGTAGEGASRGVNNGPLSATPQMQYWIKKRQHDHKSKLHLRRASVQLQAHFASEILQRVVAESLETGGSVLTALINRLQPTTCGNSSASLPPPAVLHR
jgi:hypothetical protein